MRRLATQVEFVTDVDQRYPRFLRKYLKKSVLKIKPNRRIKLEKWVAVGVGRARDSVGLKLTRGLLQFPWILPCVVLSLHWRFQQLANCLSSGCIFVLCSYSSAQEPSQMIEVGRPNAGMTPFCWRRKPRSPWWKASSLAKIDWNSAHVQWF